MRRREFIGAAAGAAAASLLGQSILLGSNKSPDSDLVVVSEGEPEELVKAALNALGGMSKFISKGDVVVIKPNMSWDRVPAQAATTNPDVVVAVVRLCLEAGASKVKIFDNTLNEARRCYKRSGIEKAASDAGADVSYIYERKFKRVRFPDGVAVKDWEIYQDVLEADRIINLPIAKHHSISGVSLGMKNYMGWIGGNRGKFHRDFSTKITDLNTMIKADLTILDAYRMLVRNGPTGGSLDDVKTPKTVVAGTDPVAIDSYGATMFDLDPSRIEFLQEAEKRGLGTTKLKNLNINKIQLS